jgi:hypothetical protein
MVFHVSISFYCNRLDRIHPIAEGMANASDAERGLMAALRRSWSQALGSKEL